MEYAIREAIAEDLEVLDRIYRENMKGYVEKVYPWNDHLFRDRFIAQDYQVIESKKELIGFMKLVTRETDIYLAEIQIRKKYQRQGIGTNLIQSIIQQAELQNKNLWLKIVKGNPAENLYSRLGFMVFEESLTHKKMKKAPLNQ